MTEEPTKYELMVVLYQEKTSRCPDGFDEESCMVGNGMNVIRWLLHHDNSLKEFKLIKKEKR